jgi:Domain of unknown function (DUF4442)
MRDGNNARSCPRIKYVEYLAKAETGLVVRAGFDTPPVFSAAAELSVTVEILNARRHPVLRAGIAMWVSPKNWQADGCFLEVTNGNDPKRK